MKKLFQGLCVNSLTLDISEPEIIFVGEFVLRQLGERLELLVLAII